MDASSCRAHIQWLKETKQMACKDAWAAVLAECQGKQNSCSACTLQDACGASAA
jgi:hypothetical protein